MVTREEMPTPVSLNWRRSAWGVTPARLWERWRSRCRARQLLWRWQRYVVFAVVLDSIRISAGPRLSPSLESGYAPRGATVAMIGRSSSC